MVDCAGGWKATLRDRNPVGTAQPSLTPPPLAVALPRMLEKIETALATLGSSGAGSSIARLRSGRSGGYGNAGALHRVRPLSRPLGLSG
jgi:hypothetical protein